MVRRAAAGDREAFDALYDEHVDRVYALCLRLSADRRWAEELVQDVFVKVWGRLDSFRGDSAFTTWLHRVTVNTVRDAQRGRNRRPAQLSVVPEEAYRGSGEDPSAGDPADRMALERALTSLPERARMAIVLHGIEGYKYEEVAELMEISVGAVKSHIHRARALLLERLEEG